MKKILLSLLCVAALFSVCQAAKTKAKKSSHMDKAMAERQKKILARPYETNRLELAKPVRKGELLLRPTFHSCGFYFGTDKVNEPVLQFRKAGGEWQKAFTPVHFHETENTTSGLVMNEYRGSIVKLEENTTYEVRFCDGDNVLKSGKFTTWKSEVPIARTIYINADNFKAPYVISAKGKPDGWIRYMIRGGKVLNNKSTKPAFEVKGAKYVLLDDMVIKNGVNSREVINIVNSQNVRVRNCEITGWGRVGVQRFDAKGQFYEERNIKKILAGKKASSINFDGAISIRTGSSCVVVERCYIHDPYSHANCWFYSHPAGPEAIMLYKPDHSVVIRYNDFIGSDVHRFNDAVESAGNFHSNGGINRDADVYGNYMIYCNDDNIELDGGQQNVRCFWNHFEAALCGVSIQGCMVSPVYLFENIFAGMGSEFGKTNASIKTGGGKHGINPHAFIFNNTFVGKGRGIGLMSTLKSILKNNIFAGSHQTVTNVANCPSSEFESNSLTSLKGGAKEGLEEIDTAIPELAKGKYFPKDAAEAVAIPNFLPEGGIRGAFQNEKIELPYRPIPVVLDRTRIENVKVRNGKASPAQVTITATVGGENFKSAYSIRKNNVFDWFTVTPSKGVLKSGDKITFTVKFLPEKMNKRHDYRGAFSVRLADGFSRVVAITADTDFVQPFKLEKKGDIAVYIDAFKPAKVYNAKTNRKSNISVKNDKLGVNGKIVQINSRNIVEYTVNVPKDGRYYFMVRGYSSFTPKLDFAVNNDKFAESRQQTKPYMSWTMFTPGKGFGDMNKHYDLKKGENRIRFRTRGGVFAIDGLVMTDNPGSFEPR